ncbi:hypothetical protein G7Y79_00017g042510 [Physcia stellaris]|nr:hypothetical protein G7Y79_00017g042510 [Physcia stellaris]
MPPPPTFAARRKARKVGQDEDDSSSQPPDMSNADAAQNAARKSRLPAPDRTRDDEQRPSYTTDALNELKSSTPSAPIPSTSADPGSDEIALDLASKFGTDLALRAENGIIPTTAEIAEKKARRKRLAAESSYISLHGTEDSDDEPRDDDILERPKHKYSETRLVPEDEEIAEGFDDFVSDGAVALGRKAQREQSRQRKAEIRDLIADAEGEGESSSDDSEAERTRAYEVAQTRKGLEGLRHPDDSQQQEQQQRPRTPPKITPLPSLQGCLEKWRERATLLGRQKESRLRRLEEVRREKADIAGREVEIQRLLREAGEVYERLRVEAGVLVGGIGVDGRGLLGDGGGVADEGRAGIGMGMGMGRGLESFGGTPNTNRASPSLESTPRRVEAMSP